MIFDFNAYLGNYPFRRIKYNSPKKLVNLMDRVGVNKALVSRFEGVFYKNWLEANRMLIEDIKIKNPNTTERFMMCLAVNPNAPGWILDFKRCIKEANALRVYPNYHGYNLEDQRFYDLVEIAASHDLPIIVTVRIQDERSHPWFLKMSPVNVTDILRVSKRYPETQFIISNAYLNEVLPSKKEIVRLENVYVELSFISSVTLNSIEMLSAEIGADRMVLGTYMPFFYPECAINRVKKSELSTEEKEFILWKNAAKLLKID